MDYNDYLGSLAIPAIRDIFPARLKALREAIGISQEAFSKALGVSRATIGYYENGSRLPDIAFLDVLVMKTGCNIHFLMGHSEHMNETYAEFGAEAELNDDEIDSLVALSYYKSFRRFIRDGSILELFHMLDVLSSSETDPIAREVFYYKLCNDFRQIAERLHAKSKIEREIGSENYTDYELVEYIEKAKEKWEQSKREYASHEAEILKGTETSVMKKPEANDPIGMFRMKMLRNSGGRE